jgi:PAS domain S-box-containing protein
MHYTDRKVTAIVTWMTALMVGLVALGLPLVYFGLSYSFHDSALKTETEINAHIVDELINANPDMWRYEELRLAELMRRRPGAGTPEVRRIRDLDNRVVAESGEALPWPVHARRADLRDSGSEVGTIEISRSLRPLLERTALLALLGGLLGFAGFISLRTIPLRMLRRAVGALYEEKERAQVTLRSIGDGVITTDARGDVLLLNGVAERLTGWTQQEAKGRRLSEVFRIVNERTREACENPVDRVLREQRTVDLANDTVLIAKDGTERVIADSGAPIGGEEGGIIGVVLVFRDVTDKRKLREEMQRADKLESVGLLAGGIAHDFNNILASIMGNISLAQLCPACDEEMNDFLTKAENACVRARDLTGQLLTFAKGGAPVKELLSLGDLVRTSSDFALTGSNVRAEFHIADDLPPVSVDSGQINQVINNLVINAVEAMPGGGMITVRVERVLMGEKDLPPLPAGPYALVSVRDRGAGIATEVLPRIFDPYFSTKKRGSGLGLATCYSIVRKHGGHIAALSEPGKGATFRFYLPASTVSSIIHRQPPVDGVIRGSGRVLVMDDDEAVRTTAGRMLERLGYDVELAADGAEAIALFQEALYAARPFDAVILDLTIPGGMGGKETVRYLLELSPGTKAIVSSGYSDNPVVGDFASHGFCGVLSKPYDMKLMSRVLNQAFRKGTIP